MPRRATAAAAAGWGCALLLACCYFACRRGRGAGARVAVALLCVIAGAVWAGAAPRVAAFPPGGGRTAQSAAEALLRNAATGCPCDGGGDVRAAAPVDMRRSLQTYLEGMTRALAAQSAVPNLLDSHSGLSEGFAHR